MSNGSFDFRLQGFPAANRDATFELVNQATGQQLSAKPFLDGSLVMRDLDPGNWEVTVRHPNLVNAIDRRIVRLFPQPFPTLVPIPVRPELFRDTPIRDIPDADLAPVQQRAASAGSAVGGLGGKAPGEVIRAEDWNLLVGAVSDLAAALGELTRVVSPLGHDHPEIAEKIAEVQGNIQRFSESFGQSLLELRRDLESQQIRKRLDLVLDAGAASAALRDRVGIRFDDLVAATTTSTSRWSTTLANQSNALQREVLELALEQDQPDEFLATPAVTQTLELLGSFSGAGGQVRAEDELSTYRRAGITAGSAISTIFR